MMKPTSTAFASVPHPSVPVVNGQLTTEANVLQSPNNQYMLSNQYNQQMAYMYQQAASAQMANAMQMGAMSPMTPNTPQQPPMMGSLPSGPPSLVPQFSTQQSPPLLTPQFQNNMSTGSSTAAPITPTTPQNLYQTAQTSTVVPAPQEPSSYSPQAVISVKPIDMMNAWETANWIGLIGQVKGWPEASEYASSFYNQGMTGFMLAKLNISDLENHFGIKKHGHRLEMMACIRQVHPHMDQQDNRSCSGMYMSGFESGYTPAMSDVSRSESAFDASRGQTSDSDSESDNIRIRPMQSRKSISLVDGHKYGMLRRGSHNRLLADSPPVNLESVSLQLTRPGLRDYSSQSSAASGESDTSMASSTDGSCLTDNSSVSSATGEPRGARLVLKLPGPPASAVVMMVELKKHFAANGFMVNVRSDDSIPKDDTKFIVVFENTHEANRALSMRDEIGYELAPYTEAPKKKGPRPTPSKPLRYKVLHHARMRSGKSMKSEVMGFVRKGEVYWVNQIKGKRARLIERTEEGDVNLGWVSLRNNAGYQLMAPFEL